MIAPNGQLRVYVATRPVDFRKGMDGLALAVQEILGLDPFSGAAARSGPTGSRFWSGTVRDLFWFTSGWKERSLSGRRCRTG